MAKVMNNSKLNLNFDLVAKARNIAKNIALETQNYIKNYTTVTIERTVGRLLGIDGVNEFDVPLPNVLVDSLNTPNSLSNDQPPMTSIRIPRY